MAALPSRQPAIARIWRGRTSRARADAYEAYHHEAGVEPLIHKALGVQTFREDREHETEFVTISYWESVEEMSSFTGGDPTAVHHLERDPEFLLELPARCRSCACSRAMGSSRPRSKPVDRLFGHWVAFMFRPLCLLT